jgi:hypothetical protein
MRQTDRHLGGGGPKTTKISSVALKETVKKKNRTQSTQHQPELMVFSAWFLPLSKTRFSPATARAMPSSHATSSSPLDAAKQSEGHPRWLTSKVFDLPEMWMGPTRYDGRTTLSSTFFF